MATPVLCCGFECGSSAPGAAGSHLISTVGTTSFSTTTVRNGLRAGRCNPSANVAGFNFSHSVTNNKNVLRFYVRFATLPNADILIGSGAQGTNRIGCVFKQSDSKLYAGSLSGGTFQFGATGVAVTTGVWYRIDINIDSQSNPWVVDVKVDDTACGQHTRAIAGTALTSYSLGDPVTSYTGDVFFDDFLISQTAADYPIGAGKVLHFIPTSDGTHNIAGTGDFARGTSGTDILNATTTAFQLVDDEPLPTSVTAADSIAGTAPANPTTDYVECKFGVGTGVSMPSTAPRSVELLVAYHAAATTSGQQQVKLVDNATVDASFDTGVAAGVTTIRFSRKHFASAPSGVAWNLNGSGDGAFDNLKFRFFAPDANPDQFLDGVMIEAEFSDAPPPEVGGGIGGMNLALMGMGEL